MNRRVTLALRREALVRASAIEREALARALGRLRPSFTAADRVRGAVRALRSRPWLLLPALALVAAAGPRRLLRLARVGLRLWVGWRALRRLAYAAAVERGT